MREIKDYLLVPVELCKESVSNKLAKETAVWLAFKSLCEGQIKLTKETIDRVKSLVGYKSKKSIYNKIQKLIDLNWVGKDQNGWYYIGGFGRVKKQMGITTKSSARLYPESDLPHIEEFLFSASVGSLVKRRIAARNNKRGSSTSGNIVDEIPGIPFGPETLSTSFLSNYFSLSQGKISNLKRDSVDAGYISLKKRYSKDPAITRPEYAKFANESFSGRVINGKSGRFVRLTDKITPEITFKTRRYDG